jgi:hypothetical protein
VTKSPRRIGVKLRNRFDPFQRIALAIQIEAGDLLRNPSSDRARSGIRNDQRNSRRPRARLRWRINFIRSAGAVIDSSIRAKT